MSKNWNGLLIALSLVLSGCVTAKKMAAVRAIPVGFKEVQVAAIVGEPKLKDRTEDGRERWLWVRRTPYGTESAFLIFREGRVVSRGSEEEHDGKIWKEPPPEGPAQTNLAAIAAQPATNLVIETPREIKHQKSSEEIGRQQEEVLTTAQKEGPQLDVKAKTPSDEEKARLGQTGPLEVPALTAWYIARQFVSERLAPSRTLFPNPRFATNLAGEERVNGNVWRAWGYVDTLDSGNVRKRRHWTAELEFFGGTRWELKDLAFAESSPTPKK
jgi:hypothetical protein